MHWLTELATYVATTRGLAVTLFANADGTLTESDSCDALVLDAISGLLAAAVAAGAADPAITPADLLSLANGIAAVTENDPSATARLLTLATRGLGPA